MFKTHYSCWLTTGIPVHIGEQSRIYKGLYHLRLYDYHQPAISTNFGG
jgi:hypothetical protein